MKGRRFELHRPAMHRERADSHRVVVRHPDVSQRRADREREPELVVAFGQSHRRARIDQRRDFDLPIGAIGSQHQFVEPRERVPVEEAQIVAGRVFLVIFRFDSEALNAAQRALAGTHSEGALDAEHQSVELAQIFGLESACLEHRRPPILSRREPT